MNRPPSVILSEAKDLTHRAEILRFAQDDKRRDSQRDKQVLSIPATFWPPFLGLLNE